MKVDFSNRVGALGSVSLRKHWSAYLKHQCCRSSIVDALESCICTLTWLSSRKVVKGIMHQGIIVFSYQRMGR
ncbi:hypothetical protein Scep_026019 [Stephania cephalantha]|uniref:Uncharacterized protein n=1 Tax=Stephania cephalantha TaxID=152367 RepID=A0AAP0ELU8_9MAGN